MSTPTSSHLPGREPSDAVLLTILESALLRLLERGLDAAAEESIRRVMAQLQHHQHQTRPPFMAGPDAVWASEGPSKNVIPFPVRRTTPCGND